ncbi:hypothetical protein [Streptomyces anulatus]|uniref:hypothetical protein n=1 Tax=Streptomyces anulatus TaxID=1892 RepID=UPI0036B97B3E
MNSSPASPWNEAGRLRGGRHFAGEQPGERGGPVGGDRAVFLLAAGEGTEELVEGVGGLGGFSTPVSVPVLAAPSRQSGCGGPDGGVGTGRSQGGETGR